MAYGPQFSNFIVDDMVTPRISLTDGTYVSGAVGVRTFDAQATFDNLSVRTALFKADATWWKRAGLADTTRMSLESYNFPGNHMRHRNALLYSEPISTSLDRSDATFLLY